MQANDIYAAALAENVLLYLKQGELAYKAVKGGVSDELRRLIILHKAQIVEYLRSIEDTRSNRPLVVPTIHRVAARDHLPVSHAQRRVWLADLQSADGSHFNIQGCFVFEGVLDQAHVEQALRQLVRHHESLRTQFFEKAGELHQRVHQRDDVGLTVVDLSAYPAGEQAGAVERFVRQDLMRRFDLSADALLRVSLLRLAADRHIAIFNMHHIISDGWSVGLLIEEFCQAYAACHSGAQPVDVTPALQYGDFAAWQHEYLQGEVLDKGMRFWQDYLQGVPEIHSIPIDKSRPARQTFKGEVRRALIGFELEQRIRQYCRDQRVTLFMFLQTAFSVLLGLYSNETDIVMGTPVAGRTLPEIESVIGLFINTVVLRTRLNLALGFDELLQANKANIAAAFEHQNIPFEQVAESLGHKRSQSYSPLFQIWFVLQNNRRVNFSLPGCKVSEYTHVPPPAAKYELNLYAKERTGQIELEWVFNPDIFDHRSIDYVAQQFLKLLERIVHAPGRGCLDHGLFVASAVRRGMLPIPAGIERMVAPGGLVAALRERFAAQSSATALVYQGKAHSYREILELSGRYASAIDRGCVSCVALLLNPGADMVAAMLAALISNKIYVPLDPRYPRERLQYMVGHAGCDLLITEETHLSIARDIAGGADILCGPWPAANDLAFMTASGADPIPYILYTSGSTGQPKGVFQTQSGLAYHAASYVHALGLRHDDRILQLASYSFDASVLDTYGALLAGAPLYLADVRSMSGERLWRLIKDEKITVYHSTPTVFKQIFSGAAPEAAAALRLVIMGGEPVDEQTIKLFRHVFGGACRLVGLYGATESSLTMLNEIDAARGDEAHPNLGYPVEGTDVFIRQDDGSPARVFEIGQIAIRSPYLAKGYWKDPQLTADRFLRDETGAEVYLTGDTGYWLPDGGIRFTGRRDFQVKLNGMRIELGEIESSLQQLEDIAQAAVAIIGSDGPHKAGRLVAYVASASVNAAAAAQSEAAERQAIGSYRTQLARWLPDYMLPSLFVFVPSLPLLSSGKVDRRALLALGTKTRSNDGYVAPRRHMEQSLCEIWQEVLGLERVGIHDNFFDAGGTSLLAMQVCAKLCSRTSRDVSVVDVFTYPTIDALARFLAGAPDDAHAEQSGRHMPAAGTAGGIAIIGMACRFPDAVDTDAFWANVASGVESLRTYTPEELRAAGVDPALIDKPNFVPTRTLLGGVEDFDADYFDFTPREAEVTDPQQRVLLECANEALEAAGYGDAASSRSVGVFVGVGANLYLAHHLLPRIETFDLDAQAVYTTNREYHCATRISYTLNLSGPSVSVNTACSTALVAVHQACRSLALGESQMALAGAASIGEFSPGGYLYQEGNIFSPDGHCRAFDRDARGTRRGNGAGVVLLKRLDQALADGDIIHAVIRGTATNNDGSDKVGYTAPSVTGQARAITQAYRDAAVSPATLQYVETHGTGTVLGDPIEIRALTRAFAEVEVQRCAIGSVKPNIGHLDAAAGIAGLIKTVEALKHKQLPPSINYAQANPQIDFEHSPFYVNTELKTWHCDAGPRRAGVSSFGIGGTNAHLVLEEAPVAQEPAPAGRKLQLLLLSARSAAALQAAGERLAAHLSGKDDMSLADVAYTLQTGRTSHAYRRAVVCETAKEAIAELASPAPATEKASDQAVSLVWMFPGQGAQHVNMARSLYASEPVFREQLDLCAVSLREALGLDLREVLYPPPGGLEEAKETLKQTWLAQPALFAIEYSLARLLQSYELQPEAMIGHSLGEYVAACVAGVFSLEQGLALMAARGRLMQRMAPGRMLSVLKDEEELRASLSGNELSVAAVNAEGQCVVSGPFQAIEALRERLQSEGIESRELETSHAGHSAMMDPMLASWREVMRGVELSVPKLPYVSNLSGNFISEDEATDPEYWVKHLRQTVHFRKGLATLLSPGAPLQGKCVLVELGPGQALSGFAKRQPHGRAHSVVPLLPRAGAALDDARALHNGLGQLWVFGAQIDWQSYHGHERRRRVQLPTYPLERRRFWVEAPSAGRRVATANGSPRPEWRDWFHLPSWRLTPPPGMDSLQVSAQSRSCIVFTGESDLAALLINELESRMVRVFRVSSSTSYAYNAHGAVIDVTQPAHYRRLFDELKRDGRTFDTIVHAFNVDDTDDLGGGPWIYDPDALELSLYSVLYLVQALNECMPQQPVRLNLISSHLAKLADDDVVQPEKAVLTGICRVIPWEFPHITCKSIDVPDSRLAPHRQASLAASVALEVLSGVADGVVAYRGERRWAQAFERVEISAPPAQAPVFRHRGVYLVTGGLGGIGLAIAAYLAESVQARLVLISRTGLPPRGTWQSQLDAGTDSDVGEKIRQVLRLEAYGVEVVVAQADVADIEQMHRVVADVVGCFGAIHGVIHAAGVPSDGLITTKTRDSVAAVIRPKIDGTVAIAKALEAFELDVFVMCSSMSAITGGFGQYDYSAANAFQDAFAVRHYGSASTRYLSINWGAWKEVGMAANKRLPDYLLKHKERHLQSAIPTSEGVNAFAAVLARPLPQWLVTTRDPESLLSDTGAADLVARLTAQKDGRTQARPELATAYVAPRNGIEISLAGIWQELLGFEGIGIHDEFFELGGDSLLATRLLNRLHEVFSIMVSDYSMRDFFESPTIEAAAERIRSALMAAKLALKRREMQENPQDVVEGVFND